VLLNISFVNGEVGHAAGTDDLLLSTDDGGQSWKKHTAPGSVRTFSSNGPQPSRGSLDRVTVIEGIAKITQDGGDHWEEVTGLDSDELRPFANKSCSVFFGSSFMGVLFFGSMKSIQ